MAVTEFQRASSAVEVLEALVLDLAGPSGLGEEPPPSLPAFGFSPKPRTEVPSDGDWVVVVGMESASEGVVSHEQRAKFHEAERLLAELQPLEARLRRKVEVRARAEDARARLLAVLPPGALAAHPDALRAAQDMIADGAPAPEGLAALAEEAASLDAAAIYGAKMVEKVDGLLQRVQCIRSCFRARVVPRLGVAVASADVEEAERSAAAAAAAEVLERQASEAARKLAAELLATSEQKLRQQSEDKVGPDWCCVHQPSLLVPGSRGFAPKLGASMFS